MRTSQTQARSSEYRPQFSTLPVVSESRRQPLRDRLLANFADGLAAAPDAGGYCFDPAGYISERLGWQAWSGDDEHPGQIQILDAYVLALQQQHERRDFEAGLITEDELQHWKPGQPIRSRIRVESGGNVGKSKLCSGLISHFYDCFESSVAYTFAPKFEHMKRTLWKEIKTDRQRAKLSGEILDSCVIKDPRNHDHFAVAVATSNALGTGREGIQGQHAKYFLVVIDEAEGVQDYVFDALDNLTSGGISIVLMIGNPRTTGSRFHKEAARSNVASFRMNAMYHPNVRAGREVIVGAVTRQSIESQIERHCNVVEAHDADKLTFELPHRLGTIYEPDDDFLCQVMGVPSAMVSDRTLVPFGRYEAACKREPVEDNRHKASMGLDCARWGLDKGTLYTRWNGRAWRNRAIGKLDQVEYYLVVKEEALALKTRGVTHLQIRVDAGGGFGSGVIDLLRRDDELIKAFSVFDVFEVAFGSGAKDEKAFYDLITEMTADVAETLKSLAIQNPPPTLEADLCERTCEPRNKGGYFVKKLTEKDIFRKDHGGRSPDDGDGFVLAVASDFLFSGANFESHDFLI
jgi:hypothetical protein